MPWPDLTEGWTGDLTFMLQTNGKPTDLTGTTVTLILKDQNGLLVDTIGNCKIVNPPGTDGLVNYRPDAGDLVARKSPYLARWQVTSASGQVTFNPNGTEDRFRVRAP
jgi:hypothetical protein